jgi:hypothetical protein
MASMRKDAPSHVSVWSARVRRAPASWITTAGSRTRSRSARWSVSELPRRRTPQAPKISAARSALVAIQCEAEECQHPALQPPAPWHDYHKALRRRARPLPGSDGPQVPPAAPVDIPLNVDAGAYAAEFVRPETGHAFSSRRTAAIAVIRILQSLPLCRDAA